MIVGRDEGRDAGEHREPVILSNWNRFLPEFYALQIWVDHRKVNFEGELLVKLRRKQQLKGQTDAQERFEVRFHAVGLVVTEAVVKDEDREIKLKVEYDRARQTVGFWFELGEEELNQFGILSEEEEQVEMRIKYLGKIKTIRTFRDGTQGLFKTNYLDPISGTSDNYILATHNQPQFCRSVFPLIDETLAKAVIQLSVTTLLRFKVLSNAAAEAGFPTPVSLSDQSVFRFKPTSPIAPSVFGFVIGDLEYLENREFDTPVRIYCPLGQAASVAYPLVVASNYLHQASQILGYQYPLEKLDFVALPFLSDGAMENWGLVTVLSNQLLLPQGADKQSKLQLRQLIAHEIVHQWVGNLVSFEDWTSLWLNEAFATWLGNYIVYTAKLDPQDHENNAYELGKLHEFENMLDQDCFYDPVENKPIIPSIHQHLSSIVLDNSTTTASLFERTTYEKGIILLSMIGTILQREKNSQQYSSKIDFSTMFVGVRHFLEKYQYKSVKDFDLWNVLNEHTSVDLQSFVHSWTRYWGFPFVKVSSENGQLKFHQTRFIENAKSSDYNLEDEPHHIPLFLRIVDETGHTKSLNLMLTDRHLELDLELKKFVICNSERSGFYRVTYDPKVVLAICTNISENKLSAVEIISLLNDFGNLLGQVTSTKGDLLLFFKILNSLTEKSWDINFDVLNVSLTHLELIKTTFVHFSSYLELDSLLSKYYERLYNSLGNWGTLLSISREYNPIEMQVRNYVLLGLHDSKCIEWGKKLFKGFFNPAPDFFLPKELLSAVFNLTMWSASSKEYKQIMQYVKNPSTSSLKHTNAETDNLQTIAVSSLSFPDSDELLNKTLNFVMTNIDSKLIELALVGFQIKSSKQRISKLWNWYTLHYDQWTLKSLRKGSDWAKQLGNTMHNISKITLGDLMQYREEFVELRKHFVTEKLKTLPEHGLKGLVEDLEHENRSKQHISSFYNYLVANWS